MTADRSRFSRSRPRRPFACSRNIRPTSLAGSRPRRAIGFHQRGRSAAGDRNHAGQHGSCRVSRRHATSIAGEKAAHYQTRRAGDLRRAGARGNGSDRSAGGLACARRCMRRGSNGMSAIERGRLVYQDERGLLDLAAPKLFGRHQFDNAGLAIATLRAVDTFNIGMAAFEAGIVNAEWPARMQRLMSGGWWIGRRAGCEIWLDGGHNADGGRVAAAALGDLEERVSRPLVVIAGMMGNKDAGGFLANFAGLTRHIIAVPIPGRDNAMSPDRLADAARALGMRVEIAASVEAALQTLARLAYEVPPRILITGSLYLAGHVLAVNGTPPACRRLHTGTIERPCALPDCRGARKLSGAGGGHCGYPRAGHYRHCQSRRDDVARPAWRKRSPENDGSRRRRRGHASQRKRPAIRRPSSKLFSGSRSDRSGDPLL